MSELEVFVPKTCGVAGCNGKCDIYIREKGVARCSFHYQRDIDNYNGDRGSATKFVFEKGMKKR